MKKLPEVNESFEELYKMLIGPIKSKLMLTGIELKVFNHLSEPRSAKGVAEAIGTHPENTRLFLDGLAACDLLEKKDGLYHNTPVTQAFLVEGSPTYLGQFFIISNQWLDSMLDDLPRRVKEGSPPESKDMSSGGEISDEMQAQVSAAFANAERGGSAQQAAEIVSALQEFSSMRKMLDLGGGPGLNGIAIVAAHPTMKGVIFDRPPLDKAAEDFIKEYEMEDRVEFMSGSYMTDSIGEGYDLIWASGTLSYAKFQIDSVMKKIFDAINPGGVFICIDYGLTHERTKPEIHLLSWLGTMLSSQGMMAEMFDQGEIADSMLRVGFKSVRSRTLDTDWGPMDFDIGRKA